MELRLNSSALWTQLNVVDAVLYSMRRPTDRHCAPAIVNRSIVARSTTGSQPITCATRAPPVALRFRMHGASRLARVSTDTDAAAAAAAAAIVSSDVALRWEEIMNGR